MNERLIRDDWQRFVSGAPTRNITVSTLESWQRSQSFGLDAAGCLPPPAPLDKGPDGDRAIRSLVHLIETAAGDHAQLDMAWILCNPDCVVVKVQSSNTAGTAALQRIGIELGVDLSEARAGTNAIGLASQLQRPATCSGSRHYLQCLRGLAATASPVFDIDGTLLAYVSVVSQFGKVPAGVLRTLLLLLIQGFDRHLRLTRSKSLHRKLREEVAQMFRLETEATMIVGRSGDVQFLNPAAIALFDIKSETLEDQHLDHAYQFKPSIAELAANSIPIKGQAMEIKLGRRTLDVTFDKYPYNDANGQFVGFALCLHQQGERGRRRRRRTSDGAFQFDDIRGKAPALRRAFALAKQVAKTNVNVLVTGESGTGKEMFANSIHYTSDRRREPFVAINCGAISRELAESEFFGYEPGAFTGASREGGIGKLEAANGGTLFLDEIGDMPLDLQAKLLRVLETRTITKVGGTRESPVDVRLIAATNRDLQQLIHDNLFREDLYYRIAVTSIHLPALRDCLDDIPELVMTFVEQFNEEMGKEVTEVDEKAMNGLRNYHWPGNIRELRNTIEFAIMLNPGKEPLNWQHLPGVLRMSILYDQSEGTSASDPLHQQREEVEKSEQALYQKALQMSNGNATAAAKILGISRATFYRRMRKLGMSTR